MANKKLKVIITGVTGMVGEGVLHECALNPDVEEVLCVTRRPGSYKHAKVKEIVLDDFFKVEPIAQQLRGYDACFFCLGVSSVGMKEPEYTRLTFDLTMGFAKALSDINNGVTFCYVSGAGTDTSERGSSMWARVKGKTENELLRLFPSAYMFRPGYMHPTPGLKNVNLYYKYISWLYPLVRYVFGKASTLAELGQAMIAVAKQGYNKGILEVKDIINAAKAGTNN